MLKILGIPGSLRASSSSHQVLRAAMSMAPTDTRIEIFHGLGSLPHFNDEVNPPDSVLDFRKNIKDADAVLIVTPEYAFGVPGSLKNALDWTVGSGEFVDKPVGLITASSQGEKGHAALLLILSAISAHTTPETALLISFIRSKIDSDGKVSDQKTIDEIDKVLKALVKLTYKK